MLSRSPADAPSAPIGTDMYMNCPGLNQSHVLSVGMCTVVVFPPKLFDEIEDHIS